MAITDGVEQLGTYPQAGAVGGVLTQAQANVDALIALIPDPDTPPAQSGGNLLDHMHAAAAAQLRVELSALRASMAV